MSMPSAPNFTSRTPVQFICATQPSLSITTVQNTLYNNPKMFQIDAGEVGKLQLGLNGTQFLLGDGEYAPAAIHLVWDELGWTDYLNLAALRSFTTTFISHRNNGYFGKLFMNKAKNTGGRTADVVACEGIFLVLSPSDDGSANTVNRIATPTTLVVTNSGVAAGGYIPANTANYYWLTYASIWGETMVQASGLIQDTHANTKNTVTFSWPGSTSYCTKTSLYCANVNDPNKSLLVAELLNGDSPAWTDLVGFGGLVVSQQPPAASTAYRGIWQGGVWFNETP